MMTRGMVMAIFAHVAGSIAALAGSWVLIEYFARHESRLAMQLTILVVGGAWGIWKLVQIVLRKDDLGNRIIAIFDKLKQ